MWTESGQDEKFKYLNDKHWIQRKLEMMCRDSQI